MRRLTDILRSRAVTSSTALSLHQRPEATVMRAAAHSVACRLGESVGAIPSADDLRDLRARVLATWRASRSLEAFDTRTRKRLPLVMFIPDGEPAAWAAQDHQLCEALLHWIARKRRITTAGSLVREFLRSYSPGVPSFGVMREGLRAIAHDREICKPGTLLDTCRSVGHLEPDGPARVAEQLLGSEVSPAAALDAVRLNHPLATSAFSYSVFSSMANRVEKRTTTEEAELIGRYIAYVETTPTTLRLTDPTFRAALATSILGPLSRREPTPSVREALFRFFLRHYGDPRAHDARWSGVAAQARDVMIRWLVQESFDVYFRILDNTADDRHWSYRRPFWERYLSSGDVIDAWAILGRSAAAEARIRKVRSDSYGVIRSGDRHQSALLMRIRGARGTAVVAEWSHNGACRIWSETRKSVPPFYKLGYEPDALRREADMQVVHHGSEQGRWQSVIREELMTVFGIAP
jgi:hypothetical protein